MKKFILLAALMFTLKLFANPVMLPPVISEFYYNGGDWQIEIYFDEIYQVFVTDFTDLILISQNDTASFVDGLTIQWNTIMVINQNSMSTAFYIDPTEDWIYFSSNNIGPLTEGIRYGNLPQYWLYGSVITPKANESIVNQHFSNLNGDDYYRPMKDSSPTIWSNAFECNSRGTFSGYVYDQNNNPVEGVKLRYCLESYCYGNVIPAYSCLETDVNGFFETDELFCNWHIFELQKDGYIFMTDTMFIEPDSVYNKEYTLTNVGIQHNEEEQTINIFAAPNPFKESTTFHINIPQDYKWAEASISIRDYSGRLVDEIPISDNNQNKISIDWGIRNSSMPVPSGMYLYSLEVDGKMVSTHKMIITE